MLQGDAHCTQHTTRAALRGSPGYLFSVTPLALCLSPEWEPHTQLLIPAWVENPISSSHLHYAGSTSRVLGGYWKLHLH